MPYPPNYGGIIDVYYKIKALHSLGFKIILHCFQYGRAEQDILNNYCEKVFYYERKLNPFKLFSKKPFIASTRNHPQLLQNLLLDTNPILFEGLHTCFFLNHPALSQRYKIVRMHNIEWQYYEGLSKGEQSIIKKKYFQMEIQKLIKMEEQLQFADKILTISEKDQSYYNTKYPNKSVLVNGFHQNEDIEPISDSQPFCLYHGNLSVNENQQAALFLIDTFKDTKIKICFAGKNPTSLLKSSINQYSHFSLIESPSEEVINDLIKRAQINLLPFMIKAGAKIKLLNALYMGKFIISNQPASIHDFSALIIEANTKEDWIEKTKYYLNLPFNEIELNKRKSILYEKYNNLNNAKTIAYLLP